MKLSRLLATLVLIVAGLAAPAPAAAEFEHERALSPETLRGICTIFAGAYAEDRLSYACEISDRVILCEEHCEYQGAERLFPPPLKEPCELAHGSFRDSVIGVFACELTEGVITVNCPAEPEPVTGCDVGWIPSEQPMT